ncbi:MAG: hypothetical protein QGH17_09115, partial [Candidatus Marinimicrobia bacterium]|nr:hypothetical protein [Candidatus Neomarinimicrobiota bacterium]
ISRINVSPREGAPKCPRDRVTYLFFFDLLALSFFTGFFDSSSEDRIGLWIADMKATPVNMGSSGFAETLLIVLPIFLLLSF